MIAAGVILRNWRAGLLGALVLGFAILVILSLADERPSAGELPLRGVPESAYTSAGVVLDPVYLDPVYREGAAFGPRGAEFVAGQIVCCGKPMQTVLVGLREADGNSSILAYALNYDTSKGPKDPIHGGYFATAFFRDMDYFVVFLDAKTGKLIYRLQPGYEDPFPSAEQLTEPEIGPIIARNVDGPNVFVTLWTFGPETTVVECGTQRVIAPSQLSNGPSYVRVNDGTTGELLFERELPAGSQRQTLLIRWEGIVIGQIVSSGPFDPAHRCR